MHLQEHMPWEAEHNKLEPGHNTPREQVYNKQPVVEQHKRLVREHKLVLVDTVVAPGNSPGDKQVVEAEYSPLQGLHLY
jgi:hypothetical protein